MTISPVPLDLLWSDSSVWLCVKIALTLAIASWYLSQSTTLNNCSTVDRLWSILPAVYAWIFALHAPTGALSNARVVLVSVLITCWALRLTFNFVRKGGFALHAEDYRWVHVRSWFAPYHWIVWEAFNIGFIALYQTFLILSFALPVWALAQLPPTPLDLSARLLAALFAAMLFLQTLTDEQQWEFHNAKLYQAFKTPLARQQFLESLSVPMRKAILEPAIVDDALKRGFRTCGVFSFSRHLNFAMEQAMWWCVYAFYVAAYVAASAEPVDWSDRQLYWPATGALLLTLLFQGSTIVTEQLTVKKYPRYAEYQRRVAKFLLF
jgi:steroid 5-alpha reductase family enzyme